MPECLVRTASPSPDGASYQSLRDALLCLRPPTHCLVAWAFTPQRGLLSVLVLPPFLEHQPNPAEFPCAAVWRFRTCVLPARGRQGPSTRKRAAGARERDRASRSCCAAAWAVSGSNFWPRLRPSGDALVPRLHGPWHQHSSRHAALFTQLWAPGAHAKRARLVFLP